MPAGRAARPGRRWGYSHRSRTESMRRAQGGACDLAPQYGELVAEHDEFDGRILLPGSRELEQTDKGQVEERERHSAVLSAGSSH